MHPRRSKEKSSTKDHTMQKLPPSALQPPILIAMSNVITITWSHCSMFRTVFQRIRKTHSWKRLWPWLTNSLTQEAMTSSMLSRRDTAVPPCAQCPYSTWPKMSHRDPQRPIASPQQWKRSLTTGLPPSFLGLQPWCFYSLYLEHSLFARRIQRKNRMILAVDVERITKSKKLIICPDPI